MLLLVTLSQLLILGTPLFSSVVGRALIMGITIQAGANLMNSYFDYMNGVDSKDSATLGDRSLVDKKITPTVAIVLSVILFMVGVGVVIPLLMKSQQSDFIAIILSGLLLAVFYTATPVGLKYYALGDITIFLCFGPLLMQATCIMITGKSNYDLNYYSVPVSLLCEAILHANNARDIKDDQKAGILTLAIVLGFQRSYQLFLLLIIGSYITTFYIAAFLHWGAIFTFITIPSSFHIIKNFKNKKMVTLPDETALVHLPFGLLFFIGILSTKTGFLSW